MPQKHDLWRGPIIEHLNTWTPNEPKKPPRPFQGTVDLRHERNSEIRKQEELKAKKKRKSAKDKQRAAYLETHSDTELANLEKRMRHLEIGQMVCVSKEDYGRISSIKGVRILVEFLDETRCPKSFEIPVSFYRSSIRFVTETEQEEQLGTTPREAIPQTAKPTERSELNTPRTNKPPRMVLKQGHILCPKCGYEAAPGQGVSRCPRCTKAMEQKKNDRRG